MSGRLWHRILVRTALSGAHVFAWIFVFQFFFVRFGSLGVALASTSLTYALSQAIAVLMTPLTAQRLRHGFKRTLAYSVLALAAAFAVLAAAFSGLFTHVEWGIGAFAILSGIYRALYWIPYEIMRSNGPRGGIMREIALACAPAVCGMSLASGTAAPVALLSAAGFVCMTSLIPLFFVRDRQEGFSWNYRQSFHELFSKQRSSLVASGFFGGIEAAALLLFWPILVFMLLRWSYPMLGIVITLTYLVTIAAHALFGERIARANPTIHAIAAISAWIVRLSTAGAVGVVLIDTFFYTGSRASLRGVDMVSHEHAADSSTFVDEQTALKEMSMGIGRIALCILVAALAGALSISLVYILTFACAAVAAACSILISRSRPRAA